MKNAALVTGASAGIGLELAKLCAADGKNLVLVARRKEKLEALAHELGERHGVEAKVLAADLADPAAPARIAGAVADDEVEFLLNNAGFGSNGAFADLDAEHELGMIQVNVTALVHLTRLLLPGMIARGRGRILNVGSTAGFQPGPYMATYYATKAFVNSFSEALSFELRRTGVTATVSCPGFTATEFTERAGNANTRLSKSAPADSATVAREAYEAMKAGRSMVVHGLKNKLGVFGVRLGPRATILKIAAGLNRTPA